MREIAGKTVSIHDHHHKRRCDVMIEDADLITTLQRRVKRCINPQLLKVHQFVATCLERHLVACYAAEEAGHFPTTLRRARRIAASPSRSTSMPISMVAKSIFPNTARAASSPRWAAR